MKVVPTLILLMAVSLCRLRAQGVSDADVRTADLAPHANWRAAIHSEFTFDPERTEVAAAPLASGPRQPQSDAITLEPLVVYSNRLTSEFRALEKVVRAEDEERRAKVLNERLGIKDHVYSYKSVLFGYKTIFFIPVQVGASW